MTKTKKKAEDHLKTIEKKYGPDIGLRLDKDLKTYLKEKGFPSLSKLIYPNQKR